MKRLNQHSELDEETIRLALRGHPIQAIQSIELFPNGIINSNYLVRTDARGFLLRVYSSRTAANEQRGPAATLFEVSVLSHLAEQGFICQRPVADREGCVVGTLGDRQFVLLTFIEGEVLEREAIDDHICLQIGERLAEMQCRLENFVPEGCKPDADYPLVRRLAANSLSRLTALGPEGADAAERLTRDWVQLEQLFRTALLPRGVVHADLYYQNVIVQDGVVVGIIDFDDAYWGVQVYDLALVLMEFSIKTESIVDLSLIEAVLGGYLRRRSLTPLEVSSLYDAMRFLCFKFLGYTVDLEDFRGEKILDNPYLTRLDTLRRPELRRSFEGVFRRCLQEAS